MSLFLEQLTSNARLETITADEDVTSGTGTIRELYADRPIGFNLVVCNHLFAKVGYSGWKCIDERFEKFRAVKPDALKTLSQVELYEHSTHPIYAYAFAVSVSGSLRKNIRPGVRN